MPDQQDKNEQLIFALDDIIAEVRRPGWSPQTTPGAAMPQQEPETVTTAEPEAVNEPEPMPEPEGVTEPAPPDGPRFPLPENVEELAAHFAPERPDKTTKKARQEKKNRRREEKELEKQRHAQELELERREAARARREAAQDPATREYVPRRMKPSPEPESQRLYREAMEQYGAPETPRKPAPKKKPAPAKAPVQEPEKHRKPRLPYDRFHKPYTDPVHGYSELQDAMAPMAFSVILQAVVLLVSLYLTIAAYYPLPLPAGFTYAGYTQLYAGILAGLQALSLALSWEVLRAGLWRLIRLRPTLDTLAALALVCALGHSILVVCLPRTLGRFFPLAVPAVFLGLWSTLVKRRRTDELRRRYKVASMGAAPVAVKLTEDRPRIAVKTTANAGFSTEEMAEHDPAENLACIYAPPALVLALALGLWYTWGVGEPRRALWGLSLMLMAAACPALMSAAALPASRAAKWLHNSGAALLSFRHARELAKAEDLLLRDGDIYPNDTVGIKSLKMADGVDFHRTLACAAGVTAHIGGGLDKCFYDFARAQYVFPRPADEFELYERGGASAMVNGDSVLMGSAAFLTRMGIRIDEGLRLPHGIFLAVNSRFCGVFEVSYLAHPQPFEAFTLIRRARMQPLMGTLDFMVTPLALENRFSLRPDWAIWPELQDRFDLHEPDWGKEGPTLALLNRDSALPFAEVVLCAKKLVKVTRTARVLGLLAALGGMGLMYMMVSGAKTDLATPLNVLLYHLLWLVPVHLLSWIHVRK